jgi:hypothetical protein
MLLPHKRLIQQLVRRRQHDLCPLWNRQPVRHHALCLLRVVVVIVVVIVVVVVVVVVVVIDDGGALTLPNGSRTRCAQLPDRNINLRTEVTPLTT